MYDIFELYLLIKKIIWFFWNRINIDFREDLFFLMMLLEVDIEYKNIFLESLIFKWFLDL